MAKYSIKIVGADSLGVRSMAAFIEAGSYKIAIDPGVSYAPRRYGLPPHKIELDRLEEVKARILEELEDTTHVLLTHYHYDHYLYRSEDASAYQGKILIVKHPFQNINVSQRIRAYRLLKKNNVEKLASRIIYAEDQRVIRVGDEIYIEASPPVPHGADGTRLGYVVMFMVKVGENVFIHASDVQGPMSNKALDVLLKWPSGVVFISGPPTYFEGYKVEQSLVEQAFRNILCLAQRHKIVIVDHHMARDKRYPAVLSKLAKESQNKNITCAAHYMGCRMELLEAFRDELWQATNSHRASRT